MTYKISKLFALFITILLIVSCRKNEQFTIIAENPIAKKSINEQRQYVRDNFKKIMKELKPIFKDSELKAILYSEIAKKFDGDYNVLIKTLINNPQVSCKVNKEKVNSLLAAFIILMVEIIILKFIYPIFKSISQHKVYEQVQTK